MRKIINIFVIALFLLTSIFMTNNNIARADTTLLCLGSYIANDINTSFDGIASGLDEYSGVGLDLITFKNMGNTNDIETSTDYDLTGPNSLKMVHTGGNNYGFINLTSTYSYIGLINFSFYTLDSGGSNYLKFYNDANLVMEIKIDVNEDIYFYDVSVPAYTLVYNGGPVTRYYVLIQHNTTNQFWIRVLDASFVLKGQVESAGAYAGNYDTFTHIKLIKGGGFFYFDNFYIDISDQEADEGTIHEFCNGVPQYQLTSSYLSGQRFLESKYTDWTGLGINGTLTDVSLAISSDQWGQVSNDLSDYKLRVNGIYFGEADNISDWDDYYDVYWITWDTYSINIVNDFPVFSFWCDSDINGFGYYWMGVCNWACSLYPFKYHNVTSQWQNTIFDGTSYEDSDCDFDLAYCFTVEDFNYGEPEPPETPDEFIITNLYFNFYDAKTGTKLQMIELSKAMTYASLPYFPYEDSYAELMLTLTAMSEGGDETHIYMPVEQDAPYLYSYLSSQPVVYTGVTIAPYSNNTIDIMGGSLGRIAGKVSGENVLWYRYTIIQEVQPFGDYDIYLIRYGDENWTEPLPDPIPWEDEYGDFFIEFYDENPDKAVECYYRLGGKQPILIYQVNDTLFGTYANGYLWELTDSTGKKITEGQIIFNSGEKNGYIPVPYVFTKEGYYQIHLYNMTVGSLKNEEVYRGEDVYVCKKTGGGGGGGTGTTPVDFIFVNLGGSALGSIVGMIITIFSLLIPFMVARGMNIVNIPMFVYAITGGMGIAISLILGLFPAWLPFFIIALGIIIAVIVFIYRGGGGSD